MQKIVDDILDYQTTTHWPNEQGALDRNKSEYITVGFQKHALDIMQNSQRRNCPCLRDVADSAIAYGFSKMRPDGDFEAQYEGQEIPEIGRAEASAFFLQTASMAHITHPVEGRDALINTAINWLAFRHADLFFNDRYATNRLAIDAAAFIFCGKIVNNAAFTNIGVEFLKYVLYLQTSEGIFPEHGGYDSSYQGVTIMILCYIYNYLQENERPAGLYPAIEKAVGWEITRIKPSGEIMSEGNTRTDGQEELLGVSKGINYGQVITGLALWSEIADDASIAQDARKVFDFITDKHTFEQYQQQINNFVDQCEQGGST